MLEQVIKPGILLGSLEPDRPTFGKRFIITFYIFRNDVGEPCILIHGTKTDDSRYKGQKIVSSLERFRETIDQFRDFETYSYGMQEIGGRLEIIKTDRSTLRYSRGDVSIVNYSLKRDVIRVAFSDKNLIYIQINNITSKIDNILKYLPQLTFINTSPMS